MSPTAISAAALLALTAANALAQKSYPERPVRLVTGYPAGGGSDFVTHTTAQKLGELLGTTVRVD